MKKGDSAVWCAMINAKTISSKLQVWTGPAAAEYR